MEELLHQRLSSRRIKPAKRRIKDADTVRQAFKEIFGGNTLTRL